jgi:ESS family glutamate:Na+ symporter
VSLDTLEVLMAASFVLLLGRQILARVRVLRTYSIPEPVVGGLLVSLLVFALNRALQIDVRFDTTLQYHPSSAADADVLRHHRP